MSIQQINATALRDKLQKHPKPFLLDVREPHEFRYARIEGSTLVPLNQIPERIHELDRSLEIVVICHHGVRSQQAALFLEHQGFKRLLNLTGGIDAWSLECEPSIPRY